MAALDELPGKIQELTDTIIGVGEKISPPKSPISLSDSDMLSDREVMKKLLKQGGSIGGDIPGQSVGMSEEIAHWTVYGKYPTDPNPTTPDLTKTAIKDNHPMMENIKSMKSELKTTLSQLGQKTQEIFAATKQLITDIIQAIITLASSAVVMPFGAGVPTGLSAVMSIFSSLQAFQTKLMQVIPLLKPLTNVAILVNSEKAEPLANAIIKALGAISDPLSLIDGLLDKLSIIGGKVASAQEETKNVKLEITNSNPIVTPETPESTLTAVATQGTWEYTYKWTSNKDTTFLSTDQQIIVSPGVTTKYTCEVTDTNDPPSVKTASTTVHKNTSPLNIGASVTVSQLAPIGGEETGGGATGVPTIVINVSPQSPYVDEIVTISASISTFGNWTYFWSFSGGANFEEGNASSPSPKVSWSLDGQKKITLSLSDGVNSYVAIKYVEVSISPV